MSARTFLLGDWNRVIRDPIDLLRLLFLVAAVIFLAQGDLGGAARTFATFGLLVLARWLDLPRPFDLAVVVAMALQILGYVLDFFGKFAFWDETLHLFIPAVVAPLLYITLVRLDALPDLGPKGRGEQRHRYIPDRLCGHHRRHDLEHDRLAGRRPPAPRLGRVRVGDGAADARPEGPSGQRLSDRLNPPHHRRSLWFELTGRRGVDGWRRQRLQRLSAPLDSPQPPDRGRRGPDEPEAGQQREAGEQAEG